VNDRSDELSTADLAGQQPGEPARPEHGATIADRDDLADDRAGLPDPPPGDRMDQHTPTAADPARSAGAAPDGTADDRRTPDADDAPADDLALGAPPQGGGVDDRVADRSHAGSPVEERPGAAPAAGVGGPQHEAGPLLSGADSEGFRARWTDVQTGFVDAPRQAVERADGLVAELMQHLAKTFADERSQLESQWDRGDDVPTDDLRTAFQRYRSFFERLLAT
jgi:hypothetical protein